MGEPKPVVCQSINQDRRQNGNNCQRQGANEGRSEPAKYRHPDQPDYEARYREIVAEDFPLMPGAPELVREEAAVIKGLIST